MSETAVASSPARVESMQLMAQDYAEVLDALKAANDTKGHERRTAARMDVQAQVKIFPYHSGKTSTSYTCLTRDLSFKGVGLFQSKPLPRESQFVIQLPRLEGEPLALLCTVMYCRELADGLFNVGATFNSLYDFNPKKPDAKAKGAAANKPTSSEDELARIRESILG